LNSIKVSLSRVNFIERLSVLLTDKRVSSNCASQEYELFKGMLHEAGRDSIEGDCKILMQYSPDLFMSKKDYCLKHYVQEIKRTLKTISLGIRDFYNTLKDCTFNHFGFDLTDQHILGKITL